MYKSDLAYIHHHGFASFVRRIGPGVLAELRQAGVKAGRVVDLGCGDGAWLRTLVDRGYAVEGIDQSRGLVAYAARVRGARVRVGSVHDTTFPRCDAMTALGEVLSYRSNEGKAAPSIGRLFRRAFAALRPGGVLIFDVLVAGRAMAYQAWRAGRTWAVLIRVNEEPRQQRLIRDIVTFRKTVAGYRRGHERHVLRVFTRRAVLAELRRAGFRARARNRYGRARLPVRRCAFVARKPLAARPTRKGP
jgi:SAM-dependent methyltransferase